jgi:hypothetical protein
VSLESLTVITLSHELAHAYTHLGYDSDDEQWNLNDFGRANIFIKEGLAQFYTEEVCKNMILEPELLRTFYQKRELQPEPYKDYAAWGVGNKKRSEILRSAMIHTRTHHIIKYEEFLDAVTNAEKSFRRR